MIIEIITEKQTHHWWCSSGEDEWKIAFDRKQTFYSRAAVIKVWSKVGLIISCGHAPQGNVTAVHAGIVQSIISQ